MTDHERIDFSALDPAADSARWEEMIGSVSRRTAPALARRAAERSPIVLLASWMRPMLATAAVLAAVATAPLVRSWGDSPSGVVPRPGVEEALQLSEPVSLWLVEDRAPTTSDLLAATEDLP